jgi:hypothetical protein
MMEAGVKRIVTVLVAVIALVLGACGDDDAGPATTPAAETSDAQAASTSAAPTTAAAPSPSVAPTTSEPAGSPLDAALSLGEEISEIYLAGYGDVVALLSDRPEAAVALTELAALKERYIQELVALGHEREALDANGRAHVDATILSAVMDLDDDTLAEYQAVADHYFGESEVYDLILSFNIIGQYANFDLLREQEPEEAARLGVG